MGKRRFLRPKTPSGKGVTVKHVSLVVGSAILCAIGILESAGYIKIQLVDRWSVSRVILSSSSSSLAKNMTNHTRVGAGTNYTSTMTAASSRIAPLSQISRAEEREETGKSEATTAPEPVEPLPSTPEPVLPVPVAPKPAPAITATTTSTVTTSVTTNNTHDDNNNDNDNYWTPPLADFAYCDKHNWIPMKDEAPQFERTVNNTKPHFSIRRQDFAPHHSTKCQTTQQIKNAIRYGQRIFDDANPHMTSFQKRTAGANFTYSTFYYDQCDLPILQPHQLCLALNRYSKIVFQGDSLTRHAHYGLLIALSNDFIRGSYPGACICDGQFTNHPNCITQIHMKANMAPSQRHLCSQLPDDPTGQVEIAYNINRLHRGVYVLNQMQDTERVINCALPEQKPVLLILQGGVHMSYNAQATFDSLIQPFFKDVVVQECLRQRKLYMIFCLSSQQSPQVDDEYPHQNRNHTVVFDETMVYLARHKYYLENLHFVHWANFTDGIIWSDGFHMATGGNYFKAQHLVNLANAILDEQLYLKHPEFTPLPA